MAISDTSIVVVAVGNELRSDDRAGLYFGKLLERSSSVTVITGGDSPEHVTGIIIKARPEVIIVVDALDFGAHPGDMRCFDADDLDETGVSTHGTLKPFVSYLRLQTGSRIYILGIQPKTLELGGGLSPEVAEGIRNRIDILMEDPGGVRSLLT